MEILRVLEERFTVAVRKAITELLPEGMPDGSSLPELTSEELLIRASQNPQFGDYQANLAMPLGKRLHKPPREIATAVIAALQIDDCCEPPTIAGPGFINLRLKTEFLADLLRQMVSDDRLGILKPAEPLTIVIDYSSPNCAKPMHVGHIRSTVIGDSLYKILTFLGHRVISDNHIGDWGTQFGMILYGYKHFLDSEAYAANAVGELSRLYKLVRKIIDRQTAIAKGEDVAQDADLQRLTDAHPDLNQLVQLETAHLHAGDPENRKLWRDFQPACRDEMERIYRRLHVTFDHTLGESFYQPMLGGVVATALAQNVATETEGAVGIFFTPEELPHPACDVPMLIRKKDGAFLYATTDLATIQYRVDEWKPDRILYLTDHRQSLHFQQLFAAVKKLGWPEMDLRHVSFGTVLGEDGKPFKTRSGDTIGLESLLNEAVERARTVVEQGGNGDESDGVAGETSKQQIAETVGIAALKYADLSQNRTSDYVFSYDKMLAMNGNTATYMQYAYARVRSIFRKADRSAESLRSLPADQRVISPQTPEERSLALRIMQFESALRRAESESAPHYLAAYLFELAGAYSTFFEHCPVLRAESESVKTSRLLLCDLVARTIAQGLALLGIEVIDRM